MINNLNIFDVSAIVHLADHSKYFRERKYYNFPVGGIHCLMRYVSTSFMRGNDVALCFDSPSFRTNILESYKAGRQRNQAVICQIETLYEGLSSCGFHCLKQDNYEADDIIDWLTTENLDNYVNISIYGNDIDLAHSIRKNVVFQPIREDMRRIQYSNFETDVEPGKIIRFNTISAFKVFCGCSSDKILAFKSKYFKNSYQAYQSYLSFLDSNGLGFIYKYTSSAQVLAAFINSSGFFDTEEIDELLKRILVVYPANKPEDMELSVTKKSDLDMSVLASFLSRYNDFDSLRCFKLRKCELTEDDKKIIRDKARYLNTGEFAADRNIKEEIPIQSTMLKLDSFTRDF